MPKSKSTDLSDDDLVMMVKNNNCSEAFMTLYDRHTKLFTSTSSKIIGFNNSEFEEFDSNKFFILFETIKSFKNDMNTKFSTWLSNQIRYFCLNLKNKKNKLISTDMPCLEFLINSKAEKENIYKLNNISDIKDLLNKVDNKNVKNVIYYRYFYKNGEILNYNEVGKLLNVTAQTALNWHNKFIKFAKKKLTNKKNNLK